MLLRFIYFTLAASSINCVVTSSSSNNDVIVTTPLGKIRGRRRTDNISDLAFGTDVVDVFLGIPYAQPPLGDLRFNPPKPNTLWDGIRNATLAPPACPQGDPSIKSMDEDCLYLNVYSPFQANLTSASYPVMVYIHGGSYIEGSANQFTGHILARHGVVVVIINYRLGAFGFLTTGDNDLPGNYGIQDQTMALKWIANNIRAFRGDPAQVTIFGNSAGGSSVGIHLLSPPSRGLFHRAIVESGPITNTLWGHHHIPKATPSMLRNYTMTVAKLSNCTQNSFSDVMKCLRNIKWKTLQGLKLPNLYGTPESLMPVVDGKVIPGRVEDELKKGNIANVPVIIGTTRDECAPLLPALVAPRLRNKDVDLNKGLDDNQFHESVDYVLLERYGKPNNSHLLDDARFEYTDHKRSPLMDKMISNRDQLIQMCTDIQITAPTISLSKSLSSHSRSVYLYVFDHNANTPGLDPYLQNASFHQLELPFVFGGAFNRPTDPHFPTKITYNKDDIMISKIMMRYWTDFAKTGNPTPNPKDWIQWTKYHSKDSEYLFIGPSGLAMYKHYKSHRVAFWNDYVPTMSNKTPKTAPSTSPLMPTPLRTFEIELIVVSVICGVLCIVVIILSVVMFKQRRKAQWKLNKLPNESTLHLSINVPEEGGISNSHYDYEDVKMRYSKTPENANSNHYEDLN